jgi:hypothetical protein
MFLAINITSPWNDKSLKTSGKWIVEKSSSLSIHGETNINSFQCDATEYMNADTLSYSLNDVTKKLNFTNSCLRIDIRRFDCHSRLITNDFRNALKANETSTLKITFLSLDQFLNDSNNQPAKGIVNIELADVIKRTEVYFTVRVLAENRVELDGSQIFSFSDFNLKAPRKMAGLIRTRDKIKVDFQLFFKSMN